MKKLILAMPLLLIGATACDWFGLKDDEQVSIPKPVPACVQQVEPKNPEIPCKLGDWWAPGHTTCSSTLAKCQAR